MPQSPLVSSVMQSLYQMYSNRTAVRHLLRLILHLRHFRLPKTLPTLRIRLAWRLTMAPPYPTFVRHSTLRGQSRDYTESWMSFTKEVVAA